MAIFSVCALFIDADGEILAISRRNKPEDLGLVGGKVDPGETPIQAVIREVREEVGVEIQEKDIEAVFDRLDSPTETEKVCRCFRVHAWSGRPRAMENGFKVRWVTLERILQPGGTFTHYNVNLFKHIGLLPDGPGGTGFERINDA